MSLFFLSINIFEVSQATNSIYFSYQLLKYMDLKCLYLYMGEDVVLTLRNWLAVGKNSTLNYFFANSILSKYHERETAKQGVSAI